MKNRLIQYIICGILATISVSASAYQIVQEVPQLRGGLNERKLKLCMKSIQRKCHTTRLLTNNAGCIQKVFTSRRDVCEQSLALYMTTQGVIQRWRKFDKITIINTSLPSRFYVGDFFMLTPLGQLIGLIATPWVTAQSYSTLSHETNLKIWPIPISPPKAYPSFTSGGANKIVFKQLLATSCITCRPRGYVDVAYLFDQGGNYIKWAIQRYKITSR